MLTVSSIRNVQNTINKNNISFKAGVRVNSGADVINNTADVKHEGDMIRDFALTFKSSELLRRLLQRQESIEKGLNVEQKKIDAIA